MAGGGGAGQAFPHDDDRPAPAVHQPPLAAASKAARVLSTEELPSSNDCTALSGLTCSRGGQGGDSPAPDAVSLRSPC